MIRVMFFLTVNHPVYSADFDKEENMLRNKEGDHVVDVSDEELEVNVEEGKMMLGYGFYAKEDEVVGARNRFAREYQVHAERVKILYLDRSPVRFV